jgi:SAM-dependent methyltransferase
MKRGFHFHTGRTLARLLGYDEALLGGIPEPPIASFAGTGNPFRAGRIALPVEDGWADVVISNGALNLIPDKLAGLRAMARCLRPGGRLQVGDILVAKPVPDGAKRDIGLWKG